VSPPPIVPASVQVNVHALHVALVERESVLRLSTGWDKPGVYVLLGSLGVEGPTQVYVGKAKKVRDRLSTHRQKPKIPWWRAIAVIRDTSDGFNSAEIGYLEGRIASELKACPALDLKADRYDLDETLPTPVLVQLDSFVPTVLAGLRIAGLDLRTPAPPQEPPKKGPQPKQFFAGSISDLLASGLLNAGAQLVFKRAGKEAHATVTADGQLVVNGKTYSSPSTAAVAALNLKAANGWVSWRLPSGKTLAELRDQLPADDTTAT
jgi:hypothetical protein